MLMVFFDLIAHLPFQILWSLDLIVRTLWILWISWSMYTYGNDCYSCQKSRLAYNVVCRYWQFIASQKFDFKSETASLWVVFSFWTFRSQMLFTWILCLLLIYIFFFGFSDDLTKAFFHLINLLRVNLLHSFFFLFVLVASLIYNILCDQWQWVAYRYKILLLRHLCNYRKTKGPPQL